MSIIFGKYRNESCFLFVEMFVLLFWLYSFGIREWIFGNGNKYYLLGIRYEINFFFFFGKRSLILR